MEGEDEEREIERGSRHPFLLFRYLHCTEQKEVWGDSADGREEVS